MNTDPISDMLTRIRNASMVRKTEVRVPYSNIKFAIAKILKEEGYVGTIEKVDVNHGEIKIGLRYEAGASTIRNITRVSKPGRRAYAGYEDLPRVLSGHGIAIVSTSRGVMTNKEARKRKLGGEVLCEVF
jgi:small subunit ribosomal protein S8